MTRTLSIVIACLFLLACREISYPLPAQRSSAPTCRLDAALYMDPKMTSLPGATILRDVAPDDQGFNWRWTGPNPAFRFPLDQAEGWDFEAKITAVEAVLSKTGPQHVSFFVNGTEVKSLTLGSPGSSELRFPIRADLLKDYRDTNVEVKTEPCLPQKEGPAFCVLLHYIGFTRELRR